jgi:GAF domain-containing protein
VAVREDELLLPIVWGSQALGVVRMRREGAEDGGRTRFSDEDVALSRAIVEQLAQTMENLRLLDETQQSADREYLIGQVTRRIRESLDLETMIRVSASEIRQAMALDSVMVQLAAPGQLPELEMADAEEGSR